MINLKSIIAPFTNVDLDDMIQVKSGLRALGFGDEKTEISPYPETSSFDAIKNFQKRENLRVDGIMKPNGPTVTAMNDKLSVSDALSGAYHDFKDNYKKMKEARTIDADKYFHCKANYEAASRGPVGYAASKALSDGREVYGFLKGDGLKDIHEDQIANTYGRVLGQSGLFHSGKEACIGLRPEALDKKY